MTAVLVDSNVLLDILTGDPEWGEWSEATLAKCADSATLVINPIVYAEVSVGFERIEELEAALPPELLRREPLPWEAGFLAGKCFATYRRQRGKAHTLLPDFYIGAHAAVCGYRLLTRDAKRYRSYFPSLPLISPQRSS